MPAAWMIPTLSRVAFGAAAGALLAASCLADRVQVAEPPVFDANVAPILQAHCVECHGSTSPAGGWSATSFLSAIGCVEAGAPATAPASDAAPILTVLGSAPHAGLLTDAERSTLASWVAAGTPSFRDGVHDPGIADPRSAAFHGSSLRAARWAPMLDGHDPNACGRCHEGAPARPADVTVAAPGAPACTTCHSQGGGVLACGTCHGSGARAYPPRDSCFFPNDSARAGAHAAHVESSAERPGGFPCSTCHPVPGSPVIGGFHGDGTVEIVFDAKVVAGEASYDRTTQTCAVYCHDQAGARPRLTWREAGLVACGDCHGSPPSGHFPGACNRCHAESNAAGTALTGGPLHLNGRVDLGNGSGLCGACHGRGDSPWPETGAHLAHENPALTLHLACENCHVVPTQVLDARHLDGTVHVDFSSLATARRALPRWDGATCSSVACHGANLADPAAAPAWNDTSGVQGVCGACHGVPPSQHTPSTSCNRADCHGAEVSLDALGAPSITATGKNLHVDGMIEYAAH